MVGRLEALAEAVAPVLAALGLELYDVESMGSGSGRTLRVTIDRDGGVDLESITAATEAVSRVMDSAPEGAFAPRGSYTLEVTSPGLERTLRTPAHFERARGSRVSVKAHSGTATLRRHGVLVATGADGFDLELDDGSRDHIAYADVVQARTVFEWVSEGAGGARSSKPGHRSGRAKDRAKDRAKERTRT